MCLCVCVCFTDDCLLTDYPERSDTARHSPTFHCVFACVATLFSVRTRVSMFLTGAPTSWPSKTALQPNSQVVSPTTDSPFLAHRMPRWLSSQKMETVKVSAFVNSLCYAHSVANGLPLPVHVSTRHFCRRIRPCSCASLSASPPTPATRPSPPLRWTPSSPAA